MEVTMAKPRIIKDKLNGVVIKVFDKCVTAKHPQYSAKRYKKEKDIKQQINSLFCYWGDLERFNIPTTGRWGYLYK